jgi:geranylgeranyl reductase family protein
MIAIKTAMDSCFKNLDNITAVDIFDVAVIGGGPSGSMAAHFLAEHGISTVLIEKESLPRYKTCGGGLVGRGRKIIPFDIASVIEREFYQVDMFFSEKPIKISVQRDQPIINMIMRDSFDHFMLKKAEERGLRILQNHKLLDISFGETQILHTSEGTVEAKFIIAADGALSPTAKIAGWQETRTLIPALECEIDIPADDFERLSPSARFDIDAIPGGYGWCFPKKNHFSIGIGRFVKKSGKSNLKEYYNKYLNRLGVTHILQEKMRHFVIPVSPRTDNFVQKNVFLIGDAAGFADPITAEGLSNAMYSGLLAAQAIVESKLDSTIAEILYHEKLETSLLPEIRTGVLLSKWFYEKSKLRNLLIKSYGQSFAEAMADVFMGERSYPKDYKKVIKRKIKGLIS